MQRSPPGLASTHEDVEESVPAARLRLRRQLIRLLVVLASVGAVAIAATAVALAETRLQAELRLLIIGVCGGLLGSCVSAGVSAADRYSHGVEMPDGTKYPDSGQKDRFNDAMIPFFYLRPFLGAGMGVLAYAGLVAGLLFTTGSVSGSIATGPATAAVRPESVLFAAVVAGLFSKTLIEKLKEWFDQIVGKGSAQPRPGPPQDGAK